MFWEIHVVWGRSFFIFFNQALVTAFNRKYWAIYTGSEGSEEHGLLRLFSAPIQISHLLDQGPILSQTGPWTWHIRPTSLGAQLIYLMVYSWAKSSVFFGMMDLQNATKETLWLLHLDFTCLLISLIIWSLYNHQECLLIATPTINSA